MKSSSMVVDWQKYHCENSSITKRNLHVQYSPYQNPKDILHRDRKLIPKIRMDLE
jgi:hypothetical protein